MTLLATLITRILNRAAVPLGLFALAFWPGTMFVATCGLLWLAGRATCD